MVEETPGSGGARSPRPAGKQLPEKRKGFMIYLPPTLHARLKTEAIKRAVSMSEVASTAVAQFLVGETPAGEPVVASTPEPFVGRFGGENLTPKPEAAMPDAEVSTGPTTYEVE